MKDKFNQQGADGGPWDSKTWSNTIKKRPKSFNSGAAQWISDNFKADSILEFGCGSGRYCNYFSNNGASIVHGIEPFPMDPDMFDESKGCKQLCFDVTEGTLHEDLCDSYDLIVSIEVLEHVPRDKHSMVFDFFKSLSPKNVVFSGATPGQKGHGHIACRTEKDWRGEFLSRGFKWKPRRSSRLRRACNKRNPNHRKNLNIFNNKTV